GTTGLVNTACQTINLATSCRNEKLSGDIYASTALAADHVSFGPAVLVRELSSDRRDTRPAIRPDGLEIFLVSNRVGSVPDAEGRPSLDIWVATRASTADAWSTPVNLGPPINTPALDGGPCLSFDGEELFFDLTGCKFF